MNALEDHFGVRLFNRSSRHQSLTQAGKLLLLRAGDWVRDFDDISSNMLELGSTRRGRLHVHARAFVGQHLILPMIDNFMSKYTEIDLELTLSDREVDIISDNIDVSIFTEHGRGQENADLVMRLLNSSPRFVCASPSYLAKRGVPVRPEDLEKHDCLTYQFHHGAPVWHFQTGDQEQQVFVRPRVQSSDGETLRWLALKGQGLLLAVEWAVEKELAKGDLVKVLVDYDAAPGGAPYHHNAYALYQRASYQSPRLKLFLKELLSWMKLRAVNTSL
jgi:DNA-binding transcriptional LysR family regulator